MFGKKVAIKIVGDDANIEEIQLSDDLIRIYLEQPVIGKSDYTALLRVKSLAATLSQGPSTLRECPLTKKITSLLESLSPSKRPTTFSLPETLEKPKRRGRKRKLPALVPQQDEGQGTSESQLNQIDPAEKVPSLSDIAEVPVEQSVEKQEERYVEMYKKMMSSKTEASAAPTDMDDLEISPEVPTPKKMEKSPKRQRNLDKSPLSGSKSVQVKEVLNFNPAHEIVSIFKADTSRKPALKSLEDNEQDEQSPSKWQSASHNKCSAKETSVGKNKASKPAKASIKTSGSKVSESPEKYCSSPTVLMVTDSPTAALSPPSIELHHPTVTPDARVKTFDSEAPLLVKESPLSSMARSGPSIHLESFGTDQGMAAIELIEEPIPEGDSAESGKKGGKYYFYISLPPSPNIRMNSSQGPSPVLVQGGHSPTRVTVGSSTPGTEAQSTPELSQSPEEKLEAKQSSTAIMTSDTTQKDQTQASRLTEKSWGPEKPSLGHDIEGTRKPASSTVSFGSSGKPKSEKVTKGFKNVITVSFKSPGQRKSTSLSGDLSGDGAKPGPSSQKAKRGRPPQSSRNVISAKKATFGSLKAIVPYKMKDGKKSPVYKSPQPGASVSISDSSPIDFTCLGANDKTPSGATAGDAFENVLLETSTRSRDSTQQKRSAVLSDPATSSPSQSTGLKTASQMPKEKPQGKSDSVKDIVFITPPPQYVSFTESGEVIFSEVIHKAIPELIERGSSKIYLLIHPESISSAGHPNKKLAYKVDLSTSPPQFVPTTFPPHKVLHKGKWMVETSLESSSEERQSASGDAFPPTGSEKPGQHDTFTSAAAHEEDVETTEVAEYDSDPSASTRKDLTSKSLSSSVTSSPSSKDLSSSTSTTPTPSSPTGSEPTTATTRKGAASNMCSLSTAATAATSRKDVSLSYTNPTCSSATSTTLRSHEASEVVNSSSVHTQGLTSNSPGLSHKKVSVLQSSVNISVSGNSGIGEASSELTVGMKNITPHLATYKTTQEPAVQTSGDSAPQNISTSGRERTSVVRCNTPEAVAAVSDTPASTTAGPPKPSPSTTSSSVSVLPSSLPKSTTPSTSLSVTSFVKSMAASGKISSPLVPSVIMATTAAGSGAASVATTSMTSSTPVSKNSSPALAGTSCAIVIDPPGSSSGSAMTVLISPTTKTTGNGRYRSLLSNSTSTILTASGQSSSGSIVSCARQDDEKNRGQVSPSLRTSRTTRSATASSSLSSFSRNAALPHDVDDNSVTSTNSFDAPLNQWTCSDVARWLTFHGLSRFVPDFSDVDGPSMVELVHCFNAGSEIVQKYLRDLGCTLPENLKLSALLRALSNQAGL